MAMPVLPVVRLEHGVGHAELRSLTWDLSSSLPYLGFTCASQFCVT